jgi:hypothetical protein
MQRAEPCPKPSVTAVRVPVAHLSPLAKAVPVVNLARLRRA